MPFAQTNGIQTYYEVHGDGRPIVMLHGALVDHRMWQPQIAPFAGKYRVVVYDLRGHGQTGTSRERSYSAQLLVEDLRALIQNLSLERPIICGLSLGGMIAQAYAAAHPSEIAALILCDTAVSTTLTLNDKLQTYLLGWSLAPSVRLMGARRFVDYSFWFAKLIRGEAWFGHNAQVRDYVRECMRAFDTAEMAKVYSLVTRFKEVDLPKIRVPTLILNGEHESSSVFRHADYMQKCIGDAETAVIPEAGHTSNMENAEAFNQSVLHFLEEKLSGD